LFLIPLIALVALLAATPTAIAEHQLTPFATLGSGKTGQYLWGVWAKRPGGREGVGPHAGQRPFLTVGIARPSLGHTYIESDSGLGFGIPGHLAAKRAPLIVTNTSGEGKAQITVIGMAFAPATRRIDLTRPSGNHETIWLHELNPKQAKKARLERFRYATFAVWGNWCFNQMVSFNAREARLWDSGPGQCPIEESAKASATDPWGQPWGRHGYRTDRL
jgi:hypothetical protein